MKEPYNRITVSGKRTRAAKVLWNLRHPEDLVKTGEVVHHKDGNKKNDSPENHEKMADAAHRRLHAGNKLKDWHKRNSGRRKGAEQLILFRIGWRIEEWREHNPEAAREASQRGIKGMQAFFKRNPELDKQHREKMRLGTIKANKARALPKEELRRRRTEYMRKYRARKEMKGGT